MCVRYTISVLSILHVSPRTSISQHPSSTSSNSSGRNYAQLVMAITKILTMVIIITVILTTIVVIMIIIIINNNNNNNNHHHQ